MTNVKLCGIILGFWFVVAMTALITAENLTIGRAGGLWVAFGVVAAANVGYWWGVLMYWNDND